MAKFLDNTGLKQVMGLMKETFALINHTHNEASEEFSGLMSAADKKKLNEIAWITTEDLDTDIWEGNDDL